MTEIKVKNWNDPRFPVSDEAILKQVEEENKQQASSIMKDIARYFQKIPVPFNTLDSEAIAIALLLGEVPHVTICYKDKK